MEPAPLASSVLFARGVLARLYVWPILCLAVQESWGGPGAAEKRRWLASELIDSFETVIPTPDDQYIEELLLQVMSDEFEVVVEDGSALDVARDLVRLWDETKTGKGEGVEKWEGMADKLKGKKVESHQQVASDEEEDWESGSEEDEDEQEEAPTLLEHPEPRQRPEPVVDDDGFTLVQSKGKGKAGR